MFCSGQRGKSMKKRQQGDGENKKEETARKSKEMLVSLPSTSTRCNLLFFSSNNNMATRRKT
jgi:hypothetical protein